MRKIKLLLAAGVLAAAVTQPQIVLADEDIDTAGIEFDFNQDGKTDSSDWQEIRKFVKAYKMEDDDKTYFAKQEIPATLSFLIDDYYGSRQTTGYGIDVSGVPEYYLPSLGLSTTVKDQNPFGTCWAFGTMSSVESNLLLQRSGTAGTIDPAGNKLQYDRVSDEINLSELYLSYRAFSPEQGSQSGEGTVPAEVKEDEPNARFDLGGFASSSQVLLTSWNGILTEEQEPYTPVSGDDEGAVIYDLHNGEEADAEETPAAHVQKFVYLNSPDLLKPDLKKQIYAWNGCDEDAIDLVKQAMVKYGALMLAYQADVSRPGEEGTGEYTNYEHWAQYDDRSEMGLNHMVSIVGWNDNYPKENFKASENGLPPKDGAFLIKNSWGSFETNYKDLGEPLVEALENAKGTDREAALNRSYNFGIPDSKGHGTGYFWLSYYDHSIIDICAIEADDGADGFDYDHIYQYDFSRPYSAEVSTLPTDNAETKVANIFTAERDENLEAVSVFAPQGECTAEITVIAIADKTADFASGTILAEQTVSLSEKGFHTIPLETPVTLRAGETFAVIEKVTSVHDGTTISWLNLENTILPELQTENNIGKIRTYTVSSPGESMAYVRSGDGFVWTDIETLNKETDAGTVFTFGNAMIKAYTTDGPQMLDGPGMVNPNNIQNRIPLYVLGGVLAVMIVYLFVQNRKKPEA